MKQHQQEWINALKHLRLHFSLLLLPIYLFALSQIVETSVSGAIVTFIILHLLVYPASNVFNSYYDIDQGSVGGLKIPPPKNSKMMWLANAMDTIAILTSFIFFQPTATIPIILYIGASRLYSYRPIRLKKYPILGFLIIFIFQGGTVYYLTTLWCTANNVPFQPSFSAILACSFQIGAIYPLTQIYQHKSDLADGVTTLSFKLGYKGTFIFAGTMFTVASIFYFYHFKENNLHSFYLFMIAQLPIVAYFAYWASRVWKNTANANYKQTMQMNVLAAICLNLFFLYLVVS